MRIADKEVEEIIVTLKDGSLVAVISDSEIINHEDYTITLKERNSYDQKTCKNTHT